MRSLTRRAVLRATAGALGVGSLAGCVTGGRLRRYRVTNEPVPDALPATVTAEAVSTPTRERPLILLIEFESTAEESTVFEIESPGTFPFGRRTAENSAPTTTAPTMASGTRRNGTQQIVLADADTGELLDGCWTATPAGESAADGAAGHRVRLAPGDSVSAERAVLNHDGYDVCYPIGVYQFTETFRFGPAGSPANESPVPWGFSLEISDLRPDE